MDAAGTSEASPPQPRLLQSLLAPVPFDVATLLFAFMAGSLLSTPVAFLYRMLGWDFDPPEWARYLYLCSVGGSVLLLPVWIFAASDRPLLAVLGWRIFLLFVVVCLLAALFFPMVQT